MKSILLPQETIMSVKENEEYLIQKNTFYKRFSDNNGFMYLCQTFNELDVKMIMKDVVWLSIYQQIATILELILEDQLFQATITDDKRDKLLEATSHLINQCSEILSITSEHVSLDRELSEYLFTPEEFKTLSEDKVKNIKCEYEALETDFYHFIISLLKSCLKLNPAEFKVFYSSNFIQKAKVVNLLAFHPNKQTMKRVSYSLQDFCGTFRNLEIKSLNPVVFFIKLLTNELERILELKNLQHTEYFTLLDQVLRLVNPSEIDKDIFDAANVSKMLYTTIMNRKIIEDDDGQDPILGGSLMLLATLDELFHAKMKQGCPGVYSKEFLNFVLYNGLFGRQKPDKDDDSISYPLCKHQESRKSALKLLKQLFGANNMSEIANFLEPYIKTGSWRTNKREKWFIQSIDLHHRSTYVGLVNLGCTCYMNSLMQQLFMCPHFRNFICVANDQKRHTMPIDDNVLYHSKYLFANLIKNKMPTYNPIVFFNSIKDFNGEPMPTNEQRDVDEFLNIYMDKIEQNILGSEDDRHLKSIFGGAFAQELICKDCPHRSSREEPYLSVSLEIKNKSNIIEALDLFIQGEMLEGDNAYFCERCDKKIDTLKRCCIKKLPNMLILTLKRFEFDLETLSRYKLNSYCEFYDELDMRNYCQETLAKKELLKKMKEENLTYEMLTEDQKAVHDFTLPDIYYKYKLKGTVVHYGTADGGHYYSFIKDRDNEKWYEFNDVVVRDYDPADLPDDAFGGKLKYEQKIIQSGKQYIQTEKLNSAYILIYERADFIDNEKLFELRESERNDLNTMLSSYRLTPKPIKIEPEILKDLTIYFDKHWIANKMFDEHFIETIIDMWVSSCTYLHSNSERALKQAMDVDESEDELYKLKFATLFWLGVVIRSELKLRHAEKIIPQIRETAKRSLAFSKWILKCFCKKHTINELCASNWSSQAGRMVSGLLKAAIRKVYEDDCAEVRRIVKLIQNESDGSPQKVLQNLIKLVNASPNEIPLSLACLYQFMIVTMSKVGSNDALITCHYLFFSIIDEFANLGADMRYIMILFRIHTLWVSLAFSSNSSLEVLVPGIEFGEHELNLDMHFDDIDNMDNLSLTDFAEDDLGQYKTFKLSKIDVIVIQNFCKDVEPFLFEFKLISKLMRSCEILNEVKSPYEVSPFRMDNKEPLGQIEITEIMSLIEPSENVQSVLFGSR